ncbi:hypothetical protein KJZ63_05310 [Patescibacteria group bacterium]|nr:hypothetical protein [Patescibacteria group bacterium]
MENTNNDKKGGMKVNPVAATAMGVAVGAGIVAAGAMALQDKKNAKMVKDAVKDGKELVEENIDKAKKQVKKVTDQAKKK